MSGQSIMQEVVVSGSRDDSFIYIWDLNSASIIEEHKGNSSNAHGLHVTPNFIAATQYSTQMINFWNWRKESVALRCPTAEKLGPITTSPDAFYCIAGSLTGKIYLWIVNTGQLIKIWDAHYKRISCLRFTSDSMILSAGEDSLIKLWNLVNIFAADNSNIEADLTWNGHTLPVTDIKCSTTMSSRRFISASLDRTCRVWDIYSSSQLACISLPAAIRTIDWDSTESIIAAGCVDNTIRLIYLNVALEVNKLRNDGQPSVFNIADQLSAVQQTLQAHTKPINAVCFSWDGSWLVSGSEDGTAIVWDLFTRQPVRSFTNHKGAITNIELIMNPAQDNKNLNIQLLKKFASEIDKIQILANNYDQMELITKEQVEKNCQKATQAYFNYDSLSEDLINQQQIELENKVKNLEEQKVRWEKVANSLYTQLLSDINNNNN
eukprot:TRINITY_DN70_c3_g4_i1.p1 TRINITY_DN70_c3_g4~~TRINITY_DN70_c3_g4_i1.p1  ORF type:complete len:457 (-),score=200.10 TRINITY_DN70_c3_g4_i1:113-1417(-)